MRLPASPPEGARSPRSVPTTGINRVHLCGHVIVLCNLLLNAELFVALVLRLVADVSNTCFLVFINVEGFSVHSGTLHLVRRQSRVHLLLLWRLRREGMEAGRAEQSGCVARSHPGTAGNENRSSSRGKD